VSNEEHSSRAVTGEQNVARVAFMKPVYVLTKNHVVRRWGHKKSLDNRIICQPQCSEGMPISQSHYTGGTLKRYFHCME